MSNLTDMVTVTQLMGSPQLPEIVAKLSGYLNDEARRRKQFYEDMTEERKVEFIGGEVVLHSPARNVHIEISGALYLLLGFWVRRKRLGTVKHEKCLCVFPRNDYEPDIVFFGPEKSALLTPNTMKFPIPDFIVEVLSESTANRDRGVKFEDYETHGVREYWIIDAFKKTVEQYVTREGRFVCILNAGDGEIESEAIAGFRIPVRAIFDAEENNGRHRTLMGECS